MPIQNKMINFMPYNCQSCPQGYLGLMHISDEAKAQGVALVEIKGIEATRGVAVARTTKEDPILWNGFGHGNDSMFTGNTTQMVWDTTHNDELRGRITYLFSCKTANKLGPAIIANYGLAYGGFTISWTWITTNVYADPYNDWYAEGFFRASNEFPITLLRGGTVQEAYNRSYQVYTDWANIWANERKSDHRSSDVIKHLLFNRNGLVILGNKDVTIREVEDLEGAFTATINLFQPVESKYTIKGTIKKI